MVEANNTTALEQSQPVSISADIDRFAELGILDILLLDRSTEGNIIWASSSYAERGAGFQAEDEIKSTLITGGGIDVIRIRACKERTEQAALTKEHAEVFTPTWVCDFMVNEIDKAWLEEVGVDDPALEWERYVSSRRLEITCGEAPYLVNRYDAETGLSVPIDKRIGVLDRKLALVSRNAEDREMWIEWAKESLRSTYGYEFQGNNLLIARINVLRAVEDYASAAGHGPLRAVEYEEFAEIISWNLWQMDGLTNCVPFGKEPEIPAALFFDNEAAVFGETPERSYACVRDWEDGKKIEFKDIRGKSEHMKFNYIIGNPPYQEEQMSENADGSLKNYAPPVYNFFMDSCYSLAEGVELIHPARFLFNAGSTPKAWNEKMLADEHFKVLLYEEDGHKIFPSLSTPLRGGVAITYRDKRKTFGAIRAFTKHPKVNDILQKVLHRDDFQSLMDVVYSRTSYRFTDAMHDEHPYAISRVSKGHAYDMSSNIISLIPELFFSDEPTDGKAYIQIIGRENNRRLRRYIRRDYVKAAPNLDFFKVFVPQASGSGEFGETLSEPIVEKPGVGSTETFLSIGKFDTESEAIAVSKYIKTKFARTLLSVLKVTQNGNKPVWRMIPLQDFTTESDIDWSHPIAGIDAQLYRKYGLNQEEIDFIETHVKEMS